MTARRVSFAAAELLGHDRARMHAVERALAADPPDVVVSHEFTALRQRVATKI